MGSEYGLVDVIDIDGDEDNLTKAVFGVLQLLDTESLNQLFDDDKFDGVRFEEQPDFRFHEHVDQRIPDAIIEGEGVTVMVESKYSASTEIDQLEDQYEDLEGEFDTPIKRLLHITNDASEPEKLQNARCSSNRDISWDKVVWTSWRDLAATALETKNEGAEEDSQRRLIETLTGIMEKEALMPFTGFTEIDPDESENSFQGQLKQAYEIRKGCYRDLRLLHKDVKSRLEEDEDSYIEPWKFFRYGNKGRQNAGLDEMPKKKWKRIPRHLWYAYRPKQKEQIENTASDSNKENYLFLDLDSKLGLLRVGFTINIQEDQLSEEPHRNSLKENKEEFLDLDVVNNSNFEVYTSNARMSDRIIDLSPGDESARETFFKEALSDKWNKDRHGKRLLITKRYKEVPTKREDERAAHKSEFVKEVKGDLEELNRITYRENKDIFYPRL